MNFRLLLESTMAHEPIASILADLKKAKLFATAASGQRNLQLAAGNAINAITHIDRAIEKLQELQAGQLAQGNVV